MYYYEIGYGSPEDSGYITLTHEKKILKKEFERLVLECVADNIKTRERFSYRDGHKDHLGFDDCYNEIAFALVQKYGFKYLPSFTAAYNVYGWGSFLNSRDNRDHSARGKRLVKTAIAAYKERKESEVPPDPCYTCEKPCKGCYDCAVESVNDEGEFNPVCVACAAGYDGGRECNFVKRVKDAKKQDN